MSNACQHKHYLVVEERYGQKVGNGGMASEVDTIFMVDIVRSRLIIECWCGEAKEGS